MLVNEIDSREASARRDENQERNLPGRQKPNSWTLEKTISLHSLTRTNRLIDRSCETIVVCSWFLSNPLEVGFRVTATPPSILSGVLTIIPVRSLPVLFCYKLTNPKLGDKGTVDNIDFSVFISPTHTLCSRPFDNGCVYWESSLKHSYLRLNEMTDSREYSCKLEIDD